MKVEGGATLLRRTNGALSPSVLVANPRNAETSHRNQANEPIPIGLGMTPPFHEKVAYCRIAGWFVFCSTGVSFIQDWSPLLQLCTMHVCRHGRVS